MAKQKHGHSDYTNSPRSQRRQQQQLHSTSLACPSSSVLSILATIAASSHTVDGSPLPLPTPPPSFLCPSINYDSFQSRPPTPTTASSSSIFYPTTTSLSSSSLPSSNGNRQVADKYVQGVDGLWRKTDAWTLFGSSCCSTSSVDGTTTMQLDQLDSVLPAGWTTSTSSADRTDSIIILSLAIVLAVTICFFMVGCIIWRRRRKKQSKKEIQLNDLELKTKHKRNIDDASEVGEREKEARGKLRLWTKASARWRSGIRHSARRRKNLRRVVSTGRLSRPQSPILPEVSEVPISSSSPSSSGRHSIISSSEDSHAAHSPENSPTVTPLPTLTPSSPPIAPSPPAYMFPAPPHVSEDEAFHANPGGVMSKSLLFGRHDFPPAPIDDDIPYQSGYAAHIAIDDKAQLARMADLASAPPINQESTSGSSPVHESAPEWQDEEFHFHPGTPTTPPFDVGTSGLPMPPSKSLLSPRYFDAHSYLEDITALDHMALPSMPPYEEGPSALPFEEVLHASAPPLSMDDQAFEHWESSAPESVDADGECATHIPSSSLQPPSSQQLSASSTQTSAPSDQAFVGGNGVLPIYQP